LTPADGADIVPASVGVHCMNEALSVKIEMLLVSEMLGFSYASEALFLPSDSHN
jgi:hypothetical protein